MLATTFFAASAIAAPQDDKRIKEVMALSEAQVIAIVPTQTPIECADPAAGGYLRGSKKNWKWSPKTPGKIVSPIDGTAYPNAQFPMDRKAVYLN